MRGSGESRRALQHYTTDGKSSVSTGADGDEFHTAVVWSGSCLIFSLEEHEDGRIILSRETWTLSENGDMIERCRERSGAGKQTIVYLREAPKSLVDRRDVHFSAKSTAVLLSIIAGPPKVLSKAIIANRPTSY